MRREKTLPNPLLEKVLTDALSEYHSGNLNSALNLADKALDISIHLKEDTIIVKSLIYRANFLMETSKYTESISDLKQAYVRCEKLGDTNSIATILGNIAVIFERMKEHDVSLEYNLKALDIKKGLKDSAAIAASYTNIGNNYMDLGKYEKTLVFYNRAIEIDTTINNKRSISADYNNFGILYSKLELFEKALFYYQKSYEIDLELNDIYGQAIGSNNIAQTYFDLLLLKNAERFSQISMNHSIESGSVEYVASNHKLLSNIYEQQGLDEKALKHQREYDKYAAQIR